MGFLSEGEKEERKTYKQEQRKREAGWTVLQEEHNALEQWERKWQELERRAPALVALEGAVTTTFPRPVADAMIHPRPASTAEPKATTGAASPKATTSGEEATTGADPTSTPSPGNDSSRAEVRDTL